MNETFTRAQKRLISLVLVVVVVFAAIGITSKIKTNFIETTPGPIFNLTTAISGPGLNSQLTSQTLYLTTVDAKALSVWSYLVYQVSGSGTLEQVDTTSAALSQTQSDTIESALLTASSDTGLVVAQHQLGLSPSLQASGAQVLYITPQSPAAAAGITTGDKVTAVNATPVTQSSDLTAALTPVPTTSTTFTVVRSGATLHLTAPAPDSAQLSMPTLGLTTATAFSGTSPYTLDLPGVGGPSGGLLFALTYTSGLAKGSLVGPNVIAGTGTIDTAGNVGSIAGITQKVQAAATAGATVFFAPMADSYDATTAAKGTKLTVVPVSTYHQALHWLCTHHATSSACVPSQP